MIQTPEYALNKNDYLKILVLIRLKNSWLSFVWLIGVALFFLPKFNTDTVAKFLVIFPTLFILFVFLYMVYFVNAKDNRNLYRSRQLSFTSDKIIATSGKNTVFDTETTSEVAINQIIRIKEVSGFWLLYVAKSQFIAIPKNIFHSKEDQDSFKKLFKLD